MTSNLLNELDCMARNEVYCYQYIDDQINNYLDRCSAEDIRSTHGEQYVEAAELEEDGGVCRGVYPQYVFPGHKRDHLFSDLRGGIVADFENEMGGVAENLWDDMIRAARDELEETATFVCSNNLNN